MRGALERYALDRKPAGGFLSACLCNDFTKGILSADPDNTKILKQYAGFILNEMPWDSHGSTKAVYDWLNGP
tara:strand:+ start:500 stop:715 length:216 start_codon:yes stop_codon:yes gene_type:complete